MAVFDVHAAVGRDPTAAGGKHNAIGRSSERGGCTAPDRRYQ
jgi:hypothetical protein